MDECTACPSAASRKAKLDGRCFRCLKTGHTAHTCKRRQPCVYCCKDSHHRSLCPTRFPTAEQSSESPTATCLTNTCEDPCLLAPSETVLMQTVTAKVSHLVKRRSVQCRLLLDTGRQRTYIAKSPSNSLGLQPIGTDHLRVASLIRLKQACAHGVSRSSLGHSPV